jgi:hypothetical protein
MAFNHWVHGSNPCKRTIFKTKEKTMPRIFKMKQAELDAQVEALRVQAEALRVQREINKHNLEECKGYVTVQMLRDLILDGKGTGEPIFDNCIREYYNDSINGELELVLRQIEEAKTSMLRKLASTTFKPDAYSDAHATMRAAEELAYLHPKSDYITRRKNLFMEVADPTRLLVAVDNEWKEYLKNRIVESIANGRSTCPLSNFSNDRKLVAMRDLYMGW